MKEPEEVVEAVTFDIDSMPLTTNLLNAHQEGNYIVGITDQNIRFRQHIPGNKLLNKIDGRYVLQERVVMK